jgi:hypothetical protein
MSARFETRSFSGLFHNDSPRRRNHLLPQNARRTTISFGPGYTVEPMPELYSCDLKDGPYDPNNRSHIKILHRKEDDDPEQPIEECVVFHEVIGVNRYMHSDTPHCYQARPTPLMGQNPMNVEQYQPSFSPSPFAQSHELPEVFMSDSFHTLTPEPVPVNDYVEPAHRNYQLQYNPQPTTTPDTVDYASYQPTFVYHHESYEPERNFIISSDTSLSNWDGLWTLPQTASIATAPANHHIPPTSGRWYNAASAVAAQLLTAISNIDNNSFTAQDRLDPHDF